MAIVLQTSVFLLVAALMCVAAVLAVLAISHVEMSGSQAIERDGMRPGSRAPRWALADSSGVLHHSPPQVPLQLIVFASHSLKSFPSVVDGLRMLVGESEDLEIVLLLREPNDIAKAILEMLGLDSIPVLTGTASLYGRYNVRVGPWLIFVDSTGRVRASSLVNYDWQVAKLHQLARLPLDSAEVQAAGGQSQSTLNDQDVGAWTS